MEIRCVGSGRLIYSSQQHIAYFELFGHWVRAETWALKAENPHAWRELLPGRIPMVKKLSIATYQGPMWVNRISDYLSGNVPDSPLRKRLIEICIPCDIEHHEYGSAPTKPDVEYLPPRVGSLLVDRMVEFEGAEILIRPSDKRLLIDVTFRRGLDGLTARDRSFEPQVGATVLGR